jgi:hypothetical protein
MDTSCNIDESLQTKGVFSMVKSSRVSTCSCSVPSLGRSGVQLRIHISYGCRKSLVNAQQWLFDLFERESIVSAIVLAVGCLICW